MKVLSEVIELGEVPFPPLLSPNMRTRIYMIEVFKGQPLPAHLRDWQPTFDAMVQDIEWSGPMYLMIDRSYCAQGKVHRGGGAHVDGNWSQELKKLVGHHDLQPEWIILVNDMDNTCCAWRGEFDQELIGFEGDCKDVDLSRMDKVTFKAGVAYCGNVHCIHESLPLPVSAVRTILRINIPGCGG